MKMTVQQRLRDAVERAGVTFVQSGGVMLLLMFNAQNTSFWHTAATVGLQTAITFLLAFIPTVGATFWVDLGYRVGRTIVTTVASVALADQLDLFQANTWRAVWLAVGMAVAVLVKGAVVEHYAPPQQARLTPASLVPAA